MDKWQKALVYDGGDFPSNWKIYPSIISTHGDYDFDPSGRIDSDPAMWGTDGLAKLEAIKAKVDPQGLFQCQKCVGFKGPVRDQ